MVKLPPKLRARLVAEAIRRGLMAAPVPGALSPREIGKLPYTEFLSRYFPQAARFSLASRHIDLWEWVSSLQAGVYQPGYFAVWPRGGAKSSTAELSTNYLGCRLTRRFALVVSETQEQADVHVQNIATNFENLGVPRALSVYGKSKGWRRNQLQTAQGFNVAAFGLDVGLRGIKIDNYRPDIIALDDIDNRHDTLQTRKKKIETLTQTVIPSGSMDCTVLGAQNRITKDSIFSQVIDRKTDFLTDIQFTEDKALINPTIVKVFNELTQIYQYKVTEGEPTWEGQDIAACESLLARIGLKAFLRECQQQVEETEGGIWTAEVIEETRRISHPQLLRTVVAVDPSSSADGDACGIIVGGVARILGILHAFIIEDATMEHSTPKQWAAQVLACARKFNAAEIVVEGNHGGGMARTILESEAQLQKEPLNIPVRLVHATVGKVTRAEPVEKKYEDGLVHHVGHFVELEAELTSWRPTSGMPSPGRLDACVWAVHALLDEESVLTFY